MIQSIQMDTYTIRIATSRNIKRFAETEKAELMLRVLFDYRDQGRYQLHGFAVMPEHLHVLLTPSRIQSLEACVSCIKDGFLDEVSTPFPGEYWQPGFREDWIRNAEDFQKQLAHIAANPERRGLVYWDFVHTRFSDRLDPMPERLRRYPHETVLGSGFSGIPGRDGSAQSSDADAGERVAGGKLRSLTSTQRALYQRGQTRSSRPRFKRSRQDRARKVNQNCEHSL